MNEPRESDKDREARLDAALAEYLRLVDRHETVDHARFVRRFPGLAEELSELLRTAERIEDMAGPREQDVGLEISGCETSSVDAFAETAAYRPDNDATSFGSGDTISQNDLLGHHFGDYEILKVLGCGGMGVVYVARQLSLDRIVALKMIRAGILASEDDVKRFYMEARAAGKLDHPNIVHVHQVGEIDGQHFYTMEYVEGTDLANLIRSERLPVEEAARYVQEVAKGVQDAHEHGIIHRDLKPANIIIDSNNRPRIGDFGLAKDVRQDKGLTDTGTSLGTPSYMSPEQAAAKLDEVGAASDIYSLGAVLYALITGRPPFQGESAVDTLLDVIHNEPTAPRSVNPRLDKRIEAICLRCLNKDPARRYASARDLAEDLDRYLNGNAVLARPLGTATRCWYWMRDVPLIAALVGRRVTSPKSAHRCVQWVTVALVIAFLLWGSIALWPRNGEKPFPSRVRFASGSQQGEYHAFGQAFSERLRERRAVPVDVFVTHGAIENRKRLVAEEAELGLLQASAVSSNDLAVVAPLYPEMVYFVVRAETGFTTLAQLASKKVAIGDAESGMQLSGRRIFERLEIEPELVEADFSAFAERQELDAAVITTGARSEGLRLLLSGGRFRLLSLTDSEIDRLVGPVFRPTTIHAGELCAQSSEHTAIPPDEVRTVATTTFLVVHHDASGEFVRVVLETLYSSEGFAARFDLVSRKQAAQWPALPLHPAAREFFNSPVESH